MIDPVETTRFEQFLDAGIQVMARKRDRLEADLSTPEARTLHAAVTDVIDGYRRALCTLNGLKLPAPRPEQPTMPDGAMVGPARGELERRRDGGG